MKATTHREPAGDMNGVDVEANTVTGNDRSLSNPRASHEF